MSLSPRRRSRSRYWPTPWPVSGSTVRWPGSRTGWSANNAALVAAILVIIGLLVLYKGIHGL